MQCKMGKLLYNKCMWQFLKAETIASYIGRRAKPSKLLHKLISLRSLPAYHTLIVKYEVFQGCVVSV